METLDPGLNSMVNDYAAAIKSKLLKQQIKGYTGYDDPKKESIIAKKLAFNLLTNDWVDVGALAAMRWQFDRRRQDNE